MFSSEFLEYLKNKPKDSVVLESNRLQEKMRIREEKLKEELMIENNINLNTNLLLKEEFDTANELFAIKLNESPDVLARKRFKEIGVLFEELLVETISSIAYNATLIDKPVKEKCKVKEKISESVKGLFDAGLLNKDMLRYNESPTVKYLADMCEFYAEALASQDFITEENKTLVKEYLTEGESLSTEQIAKISDLIKDKIVEVLEYEKNLAATNIQAGIAPAQQPAVTDPMAAPAVDPNAAVQPQQPSADTTTTAPSMEANGEITNGDAGVEETPNFDTTQLDTLGEALARFGNKNKSKLDVMVEDTSFFRTLMIMSTNEVLSESTNGELDNEVLLGEALIKYTLLETLNTMKLVEFTIPKVKEIKKRILYSFQENRLESII